MGKIGTLVLMLLLNFSINAQNNNNQILKGTIKSADKGLAGIPVQLQQAVDKKIIKTEISQEGGEFQFVLPSKGSFILVVSALGYQPYQSPVIENQGKALAPLVVGLQVQSKELGEVVVKSGKPMVQQLVDKTVVNVDAVISNAGTNALEVLEKSPGIMVDKDGNISLKGKAGVMIFMDGKPTYLGGQDLVNLLRNMSSSQLDQIEIMTNPPAKYDAAGNAGIINIKTKKNKVFGFNGSISAGVAQGIYPRNNQSLNLNFRQNKFNVFGNLSRFENNGYRSITIDRKFMDNNAVKQITSFFNQNNQMWNYNQSWNAKAGVDFYADKKTTLGFVWTGFSGPGSNNNDGFIHISNAQQQLQNTTHAISQEKYRFRNQGFNLNFRRLLDSLGSEYTIDADFLQYDIHTGLGLYNQYFGSNGQPIFRPDSLLGSLPQEIRIFSVKSDYTKPLSKGAKLEAGVKGSYVQTDANAIYDSLIGGKPIKDIGRSNHFVYDESIFAAYANYSRPLGKKWTGQLGLRFEQTLAKGKQLTNGTQFTRSYGQLFPTLFLQYTANEKNSFVFNYGRRIRRPDYESLNPFVTFLDRYTYEQGNPYLLPQFSHNLELTHSFKGFLNTTLNYTNTTDIIQDVLIQNANTNGTLIKKENIAKQQQWGLAVNAGNQYTKWWSGNIYANVFYNAFEGIINNDFVQQAAWSAQFNVNQQFKLGKGWGAEASGFYRTTTLESIFLIRSMGAMNLGLSKQLMKNKASIRLSVRDVLWTQRVRGTSQYSNIDAAFSQFQDSRVFNLGFTYRFSKGKANAGQRQRNGAEEEKSRVGGKG
ncbi:MAG: TonB-dependent receptor [Sphingobacteriia bacterium]|nr:MAG: TonB-dependent receptor [Sphingobacteriia bacterium]